MTSLSGRRGVAVVVVSAFGVLIALLFAVFPARGRPPEQHAAPGRQTSPAPGKCEATILTGQGNTSSSAIGEKLEEIIEYSGTGWSAKVAETYGTSANLERLRRPEGGDSPRCMMALVLLTTTVDAVEGVNQFAGNPIPELRTVGPFGYSLIHLLVRADSEVKQVADLCGKDVAVGPKNSGTAQVAKVLVRAAKLEGCDLGEGDDQKSLLLDDALDELRNDRIDAMLWVSSAPVPLIRDNLEEGGLQLRVIPLHEVHRQELQKDWDGVYNNPGYQTRANPGVFYPGLVFGLGTFIGGDYPGVELTPTIAVPNGLVVRADADPDLVAFVTRALFEHRQEFERLRWPDDEGAVRSLLPAVSVYESPLFCYVRLHDASAEYYKDVLGGSHPMCPPP